MSEILIQEDDLLQVADQFIETSKTLNDSLKELDEAISMLESKWAGSTQQVFYRKYKDLRMAMQGMIGLTKNISGEMVIMANRMKEVDLKDLQ